MKTRDAVIVLALCAACILFSQTPAPVPTVEVLDPAFASLIDPNAQLTKAATGFNRWTEGPVWTKWNTLLFAEIPSNNIIQYKPGAGTSVFMNPSGYQGREPFAGREPGSNGMTLDPKGRVTVAGHAGRRVYRFETPDPHGQITVLADKWEGKRLNSPNDVVYGKDGTLYFTDPPYGLETQQQTDPKAELDFSGVYAVEGANSQRPGSTPDPSKIKLLIKDIARPNGVAISPDSKYLYIAAGSLRRYELQKDHTLTNGAQFGEMPPPPPPPAGTEAKGRGGRGGGFGFGADGIRVDSKGNIWSSAAQGIWVFAPDGKHIGTIRIPERTANLTFGGTDGKTLLITSSTSLYTIPVKVTGIKF
jgi:gluconolactonase